MNRRSLNRALTLGVLSMVATLPAATEDFYLAHLQPGVEIGMSLTALQAARPGAFKSELEKTAGDGTARVDMIEIRRERLASSWYHVRNGKLAGVIESIKTTQMPIEHTQAAVSKLVGELQANFAFKEYDEIVRSADAVTAVLAAQLWEDKVNGLNLYCVASNQEITLVIFDPKTLGKNDFFNGRETLEKARANAENVRRMLGTRATTPRPIVDLLIKENEQSEPRPSPPASKAATPAAETILPAAAPFVTQLAETAVDRRASARLWVAGGIAALIGLLAFLLRGRSRPAAGQRISKD